MKVFVAGGSGFLGSRMIQQFASDGHTVFALARSEANDGKIRLLGATPIRGDLERPETLALPTVDAVVHAEAYFRFAGPRKPYFTTNVTGTSALLNAAERAGAKTFVYVSAGAVVMDDRGTHSAANSHASSSPASSLSSIAAVTRWRSLLMWKQICIMQNPNTQLLPN
jgi:nucleoside-diphosphate-sugar epimerase